MGIVKKYDEMTDAHHFVGEHIQVLNSPLQFGVISVTPTLVDVSTDQDVFWLVFSRKATQWHWLRPQHRSFIILADQTRYSGSALLRDSQTFRDSNYKPPKLWYVEQIACGATIEAFTEIAKASRVKMRIGQVDIEFPENLLKDIKEIYEAYSTK